MSDDIEFLNGEFPTKNILGAPSPVIEFDTSNSQVEEKPERYDIPSYFHVSQPSQQIQPKKQQVYSPPPVIYMAMNCIDVANHIESCPVCSKLHKSTAPVFMGIIVFLIILILFLGRKFFE